MSARAGAIENLGTLLDSLETDESDAREAEAQFYTTLSNDYPVGSHTGFVDVDDITSEQGRLDGIAQSLADAKGTYAQEIAERDAFFDDTTDPVGPGSAFNNVGEIEAEASKLEGTAATLEGSAAVEMEEAASALRALAADAQLLEDDITTAKDVLDSFFVDGVGAEFADEADLQSVISDLEGARVQALDKGADVATAKGFVDGFFIQWSWNAIR